MAIMHLNDGVIVSDCLSVYRNFASAFQRCWSHLLRKTYYEKENAPNKDIVKLHEQLTMLYKDVNNFLGTKPSFEQRVWSAIMYNQKLQRGLYSYGADIRHIQSLLGHKNLQTTQIYTYISNKNINKLADLL